MEENFGFEIYSDDSDVSDADNASNLDKKINRQGASAAKPCDKGCINGIIVKNDNGLATGVVCPCKVDSSWEIKSKLDTIAAEIAKSGLPARFANQSYKGKTFDDVAPKILTSWLNDILSGDPEGNTCVFLCGSVGNGKTHMASDCIKRYILSTSQPARYYTASSLVSTKKNAEVFGDRKNRYDKETTDLMKRVMQFAGLVVIDEVKEDLSPKTISYLEEFIDLRYQSGLPTVVISNHTFSRKTSLKGMSIVDVLGDRIADRLREFRYIELISPSKRGLRTPDDFTEEEVDTFCLEKKILSQKKGEVQILNWMTRNSIFEAIDPRKRKIAVDQYGEKVFEHGIPVDASRTTKKVCRDLWQKGDQLTIDGPVLGGDDAATYMVCLKMLKDQHNKGSYGLDIEFTTERIMRELGKKSRNSTNRKSAHRSLTRLSTAVISYTDNLGRQWIGPLFTFAFDPSDGGIYRVSFNKSMIIFYKSSEYTRLHTKLFDAQIGTDGLRMQMFLRSHSNENFSRLSFEGWMRFLEKPIENMDDSPEGKKIRRYHRRKFSELIKKQVEANLLTPNSKMSRSNKVDLTTWGKMSEVALSGRIGRKPL